MGRGQWLLRSITLACIEGGCLLNLSARRGRNQQGFCFISTDDLPGIFKLKYRGKMMYADVRSSEKVPKGTIVLDSRVSAILDVDEERDITLESISNEIQTCNEIRLGVVSTKGLDNQKVAHAMSKRIDDFQEFLDGLILYKGQELPISELGINLHILSMGSDDSTSNVARISWKQLLKIHLASMDSHPSNLCIIVEIAAATQIADVDSGDQRISRHLAIMSSLRKIEEQFVGFSQESFFVGFAFSNEVFTFNTFDSETGEETDVTSLHSSSLIGAFGEWIDKMVSDNLTLPSNPGEALKRGLATARSLSDSNNLDTVVLFFSSGISSAGQNPVKITRTQGSYENVVVFAMSMGIDSEVDIMEAIAEEGNGAFIHIDNIEKSDTIVGTIDRWLHSKR